VRLLVEALLAVTAMAISAVRRLGSRSAGPPGPRRSTAHVLI